MAKVELTLALESYCCEDCTRKQGVVVQELIRMVPRSFVMNGKLVGSEWFCCAVCWEPKFHATTRRSKQSYIEQGEKRRQERQERKLQLVK